MDDDQIVAALCILTWQDRLRTDEVFRQIAGRGDGKAIRSHAQEIRRMYGDFLRAATDARVEAERG